MNQLLKIIFTILLLNSCQTSINNQIQGQNSSNERINEAIRNESSSIIEGSIGIITTSDKYMFGDTIMVLNDKKLPYIPIIISYENQVLTLKCMAIMDDLYKVQINDSLSGYIIISNPLIKFQTWEEHVLSVFSIGFDDKTNPLREKPSNQSSVLIYDPSEFYLPNKIQGDWLQVKWGSEGNWKYGWIIWKKNDELFIELYYFA